MLKISSSKSCSEFYTKKSLGAYVYLPRALEAMQVAKWRSIILETFTSISDMISIIASATAVFNFAIETTPRLKTLPLMKSTEKYWVREGTSQGFSEAICKMICTPKKSCKNFIEVAVVWAVNTSCCNQQYHSSSSKLEIPQLWTGSTLH